MATDGAHISQYDPDRTRALLSEAGRLIRGVGFSGVHLTFIGGLVPSLLVPVLDPGIDPHIGSGDIDLCLSVALTTGQVGAYQRIEKVLGELGYKMKPQGANSASSWQWIGGEKHLSPSNSSALRSPTTNRECSIDRQATSQRVYQR